MSPGVRLRGLAARAGPDVVELAERLLGQRDLCGVQTPGQLVCGAGADDGGRDGRLMEQPRQRDVGRCLTEVAAQLFVRLELRSALGNLLLHLFTGAAALAALLQRTAEEPAAQWAVRNEPQAEVAQRRNDLELDRAGGQVVA